MGVSVPLKWGNTTVLFKRRKVPKKMPTKEVALVLLDQARFRLDKQIGAVDAHRTRAVAVLTLSGVIAAIFGARLGRSDLGWSIAAIVMFGVTAILGIVALLSVEIDYGPRLEKWDDWVGEHGNHEKAAALLAASTSKEVIRAIERNQSSVKRLAYLVDWECGGLALQLVLWAVAIWH